MTQTVYRLADTVPRIAEDAFIAPGARIIGDVSIGAQSSIWFNCVLRGDGPGIHVGARSNIQDGTIVHLTSPDAGTWIGDEVLIGHMCIIHACRIEDRGFVGMGSVVLDGAVIESNGMLGAGSLLAPGKRVPGGQMWLGRPAKFARDLSEQEIQYNHFGVLHYVAQAARYRREMVGL